MDHSSYTEVESVQMSLRWFRKSCFVQLLVEEIVGGIGKNISQYKISDRTRKGKLSTGLS